MKTIYLHGFASSPGSTKAGFFRDRLAAAGAEVLVPDLAQGDFEHLTISGQLRVVESLAAGQPVRLIGSSMGGYLAALYAARHGETDRIVLMAPAFGFARRWPETLGAEKLEEWRRTGWMEVFHYALGRTARIHYGLIEDGQRYEDFPVVTQPALVFHGRNDPVVPSRFSEEFARARPNVTLRLLESGHELTDVTSRMWVETSEFLGLNPVV
jgi:pimeloyl-ACP methyl ester carboxylesterase